jgi:anaerobic ribonucleoside-triphosphate reductase activating protein
MTLRIHDFIETTSVNGPGKRFGLWVQGCNLNCPNCFNPKTHSFTLGSLYQIEEIFQMIISVKGIEGLSISGGEPFLQSNALLELATMIKKKTNLSILIFSGFNLEELKNVKTSNKILKLTDILIAGKYDENCKINNSLLSSSNQKIHFFSNRYSINDMNSSDMEIIIDNQGNLILSGVGVKFEHVS